MQKPLRFGISLGLLLAAGLTTVLQGQQATTRTYATAAEGHGSVGIALGSVSSEGNAHDGNPATASTINVGVAALGGYQQWVEFPTTYSAGTPVKVKLGNGSGLVSLAPTITVQAYEGSSARGGQVTLGNLLALLDGDGTQEVSLTPTGNFNRIRVTLGAVLGAGYSLKLYDAYVVSNATSSIACDTPVDMLYGSTGSLASGLTLVSNPGNAIDGNVETAANLSAIAGALNYTHVTVLYPGTSRAGDYVRVLLENPAALLSLGALTERGIRTFNGDTPVDVITDPSLLSVQLLSGSTKGWVTFPTSGNFDRIQIRLGGLLSALGGLNIYEIQRVAAAPVLATSDVAIYSGQTATLTAIGNGSDDLRWFDADNNQVGTGAQYITDPLTASTSYTVAAFRTGCSNESARATANVNVLELNTASPNLAEIGMVYNGATPLASAPGRTLQFVLTSGNLPDGLSLQTDGTVTGTPLPTALNKTFDVAITDVTDGGNLPAGTLSFTIKVKLALSGGAFPQVMNNVASYSQPIPGTTQGGSGSYTYTVVASPGARMAATEGLPPTFALNGNNLEGNPNGVTPDTYNFGIQATDGDQSTTAAYSILIENSLPVRLSSFAVAREGNLASLTWATTEEVNSDRFEIEHSRDSKLWRTLGRVNSNGESTTPKSYSFTHAALAGLNYYRLKMVDKDGSFDYSDIRSIRFEGGAEVAGLYPNPVSDVLTLDLARLGSVSKVELINSLGSVVYNSGAVLETSISVRNLAAGLYLARITNANGEVSIQKIVVNK